MKLSEIFEQLTSGELSQLAISSDPARMIPHINLGLTALYKRFPLKEGRFTLLLQDNQLLYPLLSKYAVNNRSSRETVRYIQDTAASPFKDDLQKIEKVIVDSGLEVGLNDEADEFSVFTPAANTLRIPAVYVAPTPNTPPEYLTETMQVVYRASHPKIPTDLETYDLETLGNMTLELPYSHLEPLLLFVAARVHTPTGMMNETNMGNTYAVKYEQACQHLEQINLRVDQFSQPDRILRGGWV